MIDEPQSPGGPERPSEGGASEWSTVPPSSYTPPEPPPPPPPAQSLEPLPPPPQQPPTAPQQPSGGYGQVYGTNAPGADYTPPPPPPYEAPNPQYPPPPALSGAVPGMSSHAAAAISYITFIPAVIFLVVAPYNRDRFVRFHAWQSIALWIVLIGLHIIFSLLGHAGLHLLWWLIHSVILLVLFVFWLIALIKASQGQWYKIPVVGDLAQSFAGGQM